MATRSEQSAAATAHNLITRVEQLSMRPGYNVSGKQKWVSRMLHRVLQAICTRVNITRNMHENHSRYADTYSKELIS